MKRNEFDAWVAALRSGNYAQTTGSLKGYADLGEDGDAYCCLGLLTEKVLGFELEQSFAEGVVWCDASGVDQAPAPLLKAIPIKNDRDALAIMNDTGRTFPEIADWLEVRRHEFVDNYGVLGAEQ